MAASDEEDVPSPAEWINDEEDLVGELTADSATALKWGAQPPCQH